MGDHSEEDTVGQFDDSNVEDCYEWLQWKLNDDVKAAVVTAAENMNR